MLGINSIYNENTNLLRYKKWYSVKECQDLIEQYKLDGLEIFAHLSDEKFESLNFLSEFLFLTSLRITTIFNYDYNFLNSLVKLKELSFSIKYGDTVDLSNLQKLTSLDIIFDNIQVYGIEKLINLESIGIIDFREKDFKRFKDLINLKKVIVKTASIKNLEGLENFQQLDEILLANCRSLKDISQLTNLKNIKKVFFDGCTKVYDFDILGEIPSLEEIAFVDCKIIKSINFFDKLPNLKKLVLKGTSMIEDNNLLPAKRLPLIYYYHRKTYNIELENTLFNTYY